MIQRFPVQRYIEVDTDTGTVVLITAIAAADGEGDVVLKAEDLTQAFNGTPNGDARRKLAYLFKAREPR